MSKIDANSVNIGKSFIIDTEAEQINKIAKAQHKILDEAKIQAERLIEEATQKANEIIENAKNNAENEARACADAIKEKAKNEGYKQGHAQGYQDGQAKIETDLADKIHNLDNFVKCTFDIKKRIIKSAHTDIIDLIILIAQKICMKTFYEDKHILMNLVVQAISTLKEKENITLIVNPEMVKKVNDISDTLKEEFFSLKNIKIMEDSNVAKEGVIAESIDSRVDSTITSQIDEIARALKDELQSTSEIEMIKEIEQKQTKKDENSIQTFNETQKNDDIS